MKEVTIQDAVLRKAASEGMDAFVACFVHAIKEEIGGELTAETLGELNSDQITLLAWQTLHDEVKKQEAYLLSSRSVRRRVFAPMLNRSGGIISHYDAYFQRYAQTIRWDWRLLAAQCYQESCFDPQAKSWAGACGLMQIMPSTADHLGLARADIYHPEKNIAAAV